MSGRMNMGVKFCGVMSEADIQKAASAGARDDEGVYDEDKMRLLVQRAMETADP